MKKMHKKRVILYCLFIISVFILLGLLLVRAYFRTNIILTDKTIERIESSAYNYIKNNENNEDIKLLKSKQINEIYIPVEEIANKGFIEEEYNIDGIIKIEYNDDFKVSYERNNKDYLTVIFNSNNDVLNYYAKTVYCPNKDYVECIKTVENPVSTNKDINIKGYTLNSNYQDIMIDNNDSIYNMLKNNNYKVKNNKLNIYVITNQIFTMTIDNTLLGIDNQKIKCEALNWEDRCVIKLPKYNEYKNIEFNTKQDNKGYKFFEEEKYTLTSDEIIYTIPDVNGIKVKSKSYIKNDEKISILFIIDNSHNMEAYNSLGNIKKVIKNKLKIIASDNINYKLVSISEDASLKIDTDNKAVFKKAINNLEIEGYYNKAAIEANIDNFINDNDIVILISPNEININKTNVIYNISINQESTNNYINYNYYSNDDGTDLANLNDVFKSVFTEINNNNCYILNANELLEVKDNQITIDTKNMNNIVLKIKDKTYVIDDYLMYRNDMIYFDFKSFIIDNIISINSISNMEIEYVK